MSGSNTSISLNEELLMDLDEQAEEHGISRSSLIREILEKSMDGIQQSTPIAKRNKTIYTFKVQLIFEGK